jgi:hypothetical protein
MYLVKHNHGREEHAPIHVDAKTHRCHLYIFIDPKVGFTLMWTRINI